MVYDCTVELFKSTSALSPLEILYRVRTTSYSLCRKEFMHTGTLEFVVSVPVCKSRSTFHKHIRLVFFHWTHNCVVKRTSRHCVGKSFIVIMEERIRVPWNNIKLFCHHTIIKPWEKLHKVCCDRNIWCSPFEDFNLWLHIISSIPCGKAFPLEI